MYSYRESNIIIGGFDMNVLGKRIKQLRESERLNQLELAKKLNISNTTLSQYETGQRIPSDDIKIKIARMFKVSLDYLLGVSDVRNYNDIETIAAHKEGEEFTEDELKDIEDFKNYVRSKRNK